MKYIKKPEVFLNESKRIKDLTTNPYIDPKITIWNMARKHFGILAKNLQLIIDTFNGKELDGLIDIIYEMKESELLAKYVDWVEMFKRIRRSLMMFYGTIYRVYSVTVNDMYSLFPKMDMVIEVNGLPIKNVKFIDKNLYKSMMMYDVDIKRFTTNFKNSWLFLKEQIPAALENTIIVMEGFGISVYDHKKKQLKPPKQITKAGDYTGSGNPGAKYKMEYDKIMLALESIKENGGWGSEDRKNKILVVLEFIKTQSEIEDVIPYDVTKEGLI